MEGSCIQIWKEIQLQNERRQQLGAKIKLDSCWFRNINQKREGNQNKCKRELRKKETSLKGRKKAHYTTFKGKI